MDTIGEIENLEAYSAIIFGYNNFSEVKDLPKGKSCILKLDLKVPVILTKTYGAFGVHYCHLGSEFSFTETLKIDNKDTVSCFSSSRPSKPPLRTQSGLKSSCQVG